MKRWIAFFAFLFGASVALFWCGPSEADEVGTCTQQECPV